MAFHLGNKGYNIVSWGSDYIWVNFNKKGGGREKSWGSAVCFDSEKTVLRQCGICKEYKTPKKCNIECLHQLSELGQPLLRPRHFPKWYPYVCLSCYNKVRSLYKMQDMADEIKSLKNKLYREVLNVKNEKSGELREFLLNAIDEVAEGKMEEAQARNIIKMAGQVSESLYAEVKVIATKVELGQTVEKFGSLDLT